MARGGINKALVQDACAILRGRGQYPSIDAVRVQLGNTGSKTTIARYLKELQSQPTAALPSVKERISTPILNVIDELTRQLQAETEQVVAQARAEHAQEQARQDAEMQRLQHALQLQTEQTADLQTQVTSAHTLNQQTLNELTEQAVQVHQMHADNHGLLIRVQEKDAQIAQLTAQHAQTRLNLEHYRDQSQTVREQLLRQHEHQLQLLNGELRSLQGQLTISQEALILLNRDNEGLIQQLTTKQQQAHQLDKQLRALTERHDQLRAQQEQQRGINLLLSNQLGETQKQLQLQTMRCQELEAEIMRRRSSAEMVEQALPSETAIENLKPD